MKKYQKEIALLAVCIAVFTGALCMLIGIWNMYHKGQQEYEDLKEFVDDPQGESESETEEGSTGGKPGNLRTERIDYPVVQGEDNDYYLYRTFLGEEHIAGCIFMDYRNQPDFSSPRTILYGHNMKDGSMFGQLNTQSEVIGKEVSVSLPGRTLYYTVVSSDYVPADDARYQLDSVEAQNGNGELLLSTCSSEENVRLVVTCLSSKILHYLRYRELS